MSLDEKLNFNFIVATKQLNNTVWENDEINWKTSVKHSDKDIHV